MKGLLVFLLPLSLFILGVSQHCSAQNLHDQNGKKTGKWVFRGKDHPRSGYAVNTKVAEGDFVNGRKEGIWIRYHRDGRTVKLKGNYRNNRPSGFYSRYYRNSRKMEEASFVQGKYKGNFNRYYNNGKLAYNGNYNNDGEESGLIQYYYRNGNLQLEYNAKNGIPFGTIKNYYRNGSLKSKVFLDDKGKKTKAITYGPSIDNPTPVTETPIVNAPPTVSNPNTHGVSFENFGYNKVYNANDEIWIDGVFKNGKLWDGKVYDYDEDGIIIKVRVFKNGVYHSDGQL